MKKFSLSLVIHHQYLRFLVFFHIVKFHTPKSSIIFFVSPFEFYNEFTFYTINSCTFFCRAHDELAGCSWQCFNKRMELQCFNKRSSKVKSSILVSGFCVAEDCWWNKCKSIVHKYWAVFAVWTMHEIKILFIVCSFRVIRNEFLVQPTDASHSLSFCLQFENFHVISERHSMEVEKE